MRETAFGVPLKVAIVVNVGGDIFTKTFAGDEDNAPTESCMIIVKAAVFKLESVLQIQYAVWVGSIVLLVLRFQTGAVFGSVPICNVPYDGTDCTR